MYCLKNIDRVVMPNDIVKLYTHLYPFIGRNDTMLKTVSKDFDVLVGETIRLDTGFAIRLFGVDLPEARFKSLVVKDAAAKNKTERFVKNVKRAFEKIHNDTDTFELRETEMRDLLRFLYHDVEPETRLRHAKTERKREKTTNLLSSHHPTKREALETLIDDFRHLLSKSDFEPIFLCVNFYVDFINLKPFVVHNDVIGLLTLYLLLLSHGVKSLHLASFFELLYKHHDKLHKHTQEASRNWEEGLANVMTLHRFILQKLLESYQGLHELLRNYTFDQETNKSDYIENTINKLDDVFSKDDIRRAHPTISDSTINRTLRRLRDEKRIRPLGKGRSAKWMKLYKSQKKSSIYEQITLKV